MKQYTAVEKTPLSIVMEQGFVTKDIWGQFYQTCFLLVARQINYKKLFPSNRLNSKPFSC